MGLHIDNSENREIMDTRAFFTSLFQAAVAAADPDRMIHHFLPAKPKGRTIIIGFGKAAARMAAAFEKAWDAPLEGLVVTRYGYGVSCQRVEVVEASHPVPDEAGLTASRRLIEILGGLNENDLVVALVSGGGSALLPSPPQGMMLADEAEVNRVLLASGAPISAMNTVRKHLSGIKGGRLALLAHPAKVISLVVSDIPGDNPAFVASGPTVPDNGSRADALAIVEEHGLQLPEAALRHLHSDASSAPHPADPRFGRNEVHVIASATRSLEAAAALARKQGIDAIILSDSMEGEACEVAGVHAAIAREIATRDRPFRKPVLLLSGGETSVTLQNKNGRGGRNSQFQLAFALGIEGVKDISSFAADTDGIDGSEDNAGAFADFTTVARLRAAGCDPRRILTRNDAWKAFFTLGDLFISGPTGTNVNDLRLVLIH